MADLDADAQARVVYLSLLGLAVAAYVFYEYRDRLGAAVQNAAIWVLLFLGAVLAYGFKDEIAGQLMTDVAVEGPGGEIRLRRAADGHFHARMEVNGTPVAFLVDTGATDLVLSARDARRAGIDRDRLAYTRAAVTANGVVRVAPVELDRVTLAGITARQVPAVVSGGALEQSLLGMRFLDRFAGFSVEGDTLTLRP
ncbi:MAG: TIGR02281 family clan AA aspartic protease [Paracoccaceae bacterium]